MHCLETPGQTKVSGDCNRETTYEVSCLAVKYLQCGNTKNRNMQMAIKFANECMYSSSSTIYIVASSES